MFLTLLVPVDGLKISKWSLSDSLGQSAGWGTVVGQKCETPVYLCEHHTAPNRSSSHLLQLFVICDPIFVILPLCILLLMSVFIVSPNSLLILSCLSKSSSLTSVLNYWDRLKQLLSALRQSWERQKRKGETEKKEREGDMVGRFIHVLIEGFVKSLRQDVRCTLGIFTTLRVSICTHWCHLKTRRGR